METKYLTANGAAGRLGISVATLYQWLGESRREQLVIRGQSVTINYFQSGKKGQGRIQIEADEIERLRELMRVRPQQTNSRQSPAKQCTYPGIYVKLGHPDW